MTAPISEAVLGEILDSIEDEFREASAKFKAFNSYHEGYSIILEELDELWDAVKMNTDRHPERSDLIRKEAIQVAAMAVRFLHDVCLGFGDAP